MLKWIATDYQATIFSWNPVFWLTHCIATIKNQYICGSFLCSETCAVQDTVASVSKFYNPMYGHKITASLLMVCVKIPLAYPSGELWASPTIV